MLHLALHAKKKKKRIPREFSEALRSKSFKKMLPFFLADEWHDPMYVPILGDHNLYLDVPGAYYHFSANVVAMTREAVQELTSLH